MWIPYNNKIIIRDSYMFYPQHLFLLLFWILSTLHIVNANHNHTIFTNDNNANLGFASCLIGFNIACCLSSDSTN